MAPIQTYATPSRLYRCRPLGGPRLARELQAIREAFVFCPSYSEMNDPMEGAHTESALLRQSRSYAATLEQIVEAKAQLGIASFSEVRDHEPMWAHYAAEFTGICVSYDFTRLRRALSDEHEFVRMAYNEKPPVLLYKEKSAERLARLALSTKTVRWMNEREWRLLRPSRGQAPYRQIDCVSRVYLGTRVRPEDRAEVVGAMKELKIPVFEMRVDRYALTFREIKVPGQKTRRRLKTPKKPAAA